MTHTEITSQAIAVGMTEKAATRLGYLVSGINLKEAVVYSFLNEVRVHCFFQTEFSAWEFEYVCRKSTGSIIRKSKTQHLDK
jgi:hypothetical protein